MIVRVTHVHVLPTSESAVQGTAWISSEQYGINGRLKTSSSRSLAQSGQSWREGKQRAVLADSGPFELRALSLCMIKVEDTFDHAYKAARYV